LCRREDEDVSENIKTILEGEGIKIRLGAECIGFEKRGARVAVQVDCSSGDKSVIGSHVLLAVGRVPKTNDLGLEEAGLEGNESGYIQVDDQLRTKLPGILGWVIATDAALLLIPHTTIMKLSLLIF